VMHMRIACVSRGRGGGHRWQARFWPLGTDLLRRV
jgi:hypothetical protein